MPDIKLTFIQQALTEFMQRVEVAMQSATARSKVGVTDEGIKSLSYRVLQAGGGALGQLSFYEYLRFVDMGVGRGHPLGGLAATKLNLQSRNHEGIALVKDKVRRPKKIYSKPAFGELGHLYSKLLYGFTEETIRIIKSELEQKQIS